MNEARTWEEFTGAERLRRAVANFVYGDVSSHIGYYAPGHIPLRASGRIASG